MITLTDSNSTDSLDNAHVVIKGGTDNTSIGNVGDSLKTVTQITALPTSSVQAWSNKLRYLDMNASTGGIARNTLVTNAAFVTVYSYTGSGYFSGLILNLETFTKWEVRILVDGFDILLGSAGMSTDDLIADSIYDLDDVSDLNQANIGVSKGEHNRFVFNGPLSTPIYYSASVVVRVKRKSGEASKKFQSGLIVLSKET